MERFLYLVAYGFIAMIIINIILIILETVTTGLREKYSKNDEPVDEKKPSALVRYFFPGIILFVVIGELIAKLTA